MVNMKTEIEVTFENDYVNIIFNGEKNLDLAKKVFSRAVETCVTHNCYKILGIANTTKPISTIEMFDFNDFINELGFNYKYRMAWVELNPKVFEIIRFNETVLKNRGIPGKLFNDINEAKNWLLNDT